MIAKWIVPAVLLMVQVLPLHAEGTKDPIRKLKLDATMEMEVLYSSPKGLPPYPLALMLPGGPGQIEQARGSLNRFAAGFNRLGYCVVVPISKDDKGFVGEKAALILKLHDKLKSDRNINAKRTLLGGVSRGGAASLEIAALDPPRFKGLMLVPGVFYSGNDVKAAYTNMPVFLRIGADDNLKWNEQYPNVVERLKTSGAIVDGKILPNQGHVFELGWSEVAAWLKTIK